MTGRLPASRPDEVICSLTRAGFVLRHVRGSHHYFKHPAHPESRVTVPYHTRDLKLSTQQSIIRHAGFSREQFLEPL